MAHLSGLTLNEDMSDPVEKKSAFSARNKFAGEIDGSKRLLKSLSAL